MERLKTLSEQVDDLYQESDTALHAIYSLLLKKTGDPEGPPAIEQL